jgi:glucose/mannose-6-phosphate isomerase
MSPLEADFGRLDDPEALAAADSGDRLRQVASAAAQLREAQLLTAEAAIDGIADGGRPRAVVVAGTGEAGIAGDMLTAVCGPGCPVPVTTLRGYRLPGWVGAADLVIAISGSGATEETISVAAEAARRGCRLLCVCRAGSPLADIAVQSGAPFVPVPPSWPPGAALWGLAVPPLLAASALRVADVPAGLLETIAARLEEMSHRCRPASETFVNPGKQTATEIAGSIPMIWGASPLAGTVAYRFACQLARDAKYPAISGELPEVNQHQVMTFDGAFAARDEDDLFRDRVDEPAAGSAARLHLVIVRDIDEHPHMARRREVSVELAGERGVPVSELVAEGEHPLERLAGLIAHADYASVYVALATGADPAPVATIQELEARIS